jgi:hypothetical protein
MREAGYRAATLGIHAWNFEYEGAWTECNRQFDLYDGLVAEGLLRRPVTAADWLERGEADCAPLAAPGVLAGAVLGFARSLGEFGATITFVSNIPGETQTLPLAIYALVLSTLIAFPAGIYAASRRGRAGDISVMAATTASVAAPPRASTACPARRACASASVYCRSSSGVILLRSMVPAPPWITSRTGVSARLVMATVSSSDATRIRARMNEPPAGVG